MNNNGNILRKSCPRTSLGLLYRAFYFVFYAGYISFLLYVPVYFKYLGLNAIYVGILNGIRPLMQAVGAPLWGILGDRYRIRKPIFVIAFVIMTVKTMLFLAFRPHNQTCVVTRYDASNHILENTSYVIKHDITKRSSEDVEFVNKLFGDENIDKLEITGNLSNNQNMTLDLYRFISPTTTASIKAIKNLGLIPTKKFTSDDVSLRAKERKLFTKYTTVVDDKETLNIFIAITLLIFFGEIFDAAAFTLADTSCLETLGNENYGYYRLWGSVGWGMMTPIIGFFIHYFHIIQCGERVGAYFCVFYFYLAFMYLALLFGSHFEFKYESRDEIQTTVKTALLNFHYGIFLFVTFYAGFCYGFLLYFVNLFIDSLGGSAAIMGAATGCKSIVDVTLFFLSGKIIQALGHLNTVTISLLAYIGAFVSYSYISNPWYALPIEVLHSGAYALVWSSSVSYLNKAAPAGSSATVQGILQGVYWGLGTGGGTIVGGYIIHIYGFVSTFRAFAVTSAVILVIFNMTQLISRLSNVEENEAGKVVSPKSERQITDGTDVERNFECALLFTDVHSENEEESEN